MSTLIRWLSRIGDKAGALGAFVAAAGCSMCFPALASIGAALGLGFLEQWEGLLVSRILPLFAWVALAANALGFLAHRQWHRSLLGMVGPTIVLLALYPLWDYAWSTWLLYAGLAVMLVVAVWDLVSPASRRCAPGDGVAETPHTDTAGAGQ